MITGNRLTDRWHESSLREFREQVDPKAAAGFLRMWSGTDFHRDVKNSGVAALAIAGRHDFRAFSLEAISATLGGWFPNFIMRVFEGSGHHPMAEEAILLATVAERFFLEHNGN